MYCYGDGGLGFESLCTSMGGTYTNLSGGDDDHEISGW
jgi:hypothetical protein